MYGKAGESMLMGLDFYKKVIEFQRKYGKGKKITNSLQTEWDVINRRGMVSVFSSHVFLVGLSLACPELIHDHFRVDRGGQQAFIKY